MASETAGPANGDVVGDMQIEYLHPSAPGDPFALTYVVPTGLSSGVLIMNHDSLAEASVPEPGDLVSSIFLPLAPAQETGVATFAGIVPLSISAEQLADSIVEFRVVLGDPLTGEVWISDAIALTPDDDSDDEPSASLDAQDIAGSLNVATMEESTTSTGPGGVGKEDIGNNLGYSGQIGWVPLRILDVSDALFAGIHDQPTPVQGSGH